MTEKNPIKIKRRSSKGGRPKGSKTVKLPHAEAVVTRCRDCGSTERSEYINRREHECAGVTPDGQPYTHTVWRDTTCTNCGQRRCDITRENRVCDDGSH
jgi:hypothetical protein